MDGRVAFVLPFPRVLFSISLLIRLSHTGAPCMSTFPVKFQQRIKRPVKLNFSVLVASLLRLDMCYFFIFLYFFLPPRVNTWYTEVRFQHGIQSTRVKICSAYFSGYQAAALIATSVDCSEEKKSASTRPTSFV